MIYIFFILSLCSVRGRSAGAGAAFSVASRPVPPQTGKFFFFFFFFLIAHGLCLFLGEK